MKNPNVYDTLRECVDRSGEFLLNAPWENKDFYAAWLAQSHYYIRHSTRLLALTGALMPISDNPMHNRFLKHCGEEKGHENLPVMDMKSVGRKLDDVPEFPSTQAFYQTQYYAIEHVDPYAFFGYTLFLESLACEYGPKMIDKIDKLHGPKALNFLSVHSDADIEHVREAMERVKMLPPEHLKTIQDNIRLCSAMYDQICQESLAHAKIRVSRAA